MYTIYCDSLQEGLWFKNLNSHFDNANLVIIPNSVADKKRHGLEAVLLYDRPDIIVKHDDKIIFVLERTIEVPSGHNVGQRFGRLVAAAKVRIPVVYFGPYAAYKHGGATSGPRYMNLRLFRSLDKVSEYYNTAVTTINWPVDQHYEVIKRPEKDTRIISYLELFFDYYDRNGMNGLTEFISQSAFQKEQKSEQIHFASTEIRNPDQYDVPPNSVEIITPAQYMRKYDDLPPTLHKANRILVYQVGMNYIRSDPYTGMAALYFYLYSTSNDTKQILHFPNIKSEEWATLNQNSKTYRMFKEFSDAIQFKDILVQQWQL